MLIRNDRTTSGSSAQRASFLIHDLHTAGPLVEPEGIADDGVCTGQGRGSLAVLYGSYIPRHTTNLSSLGGTVPMYLNRIASCSPSPEQPWQSPWRQAHKRRSPNARTRTRHRLRLQRRRQPRGAHVERRAHGHQRLDRRLLQLQRQPSQRRGQRTGQRSLQLQRQDGPVQPEPSASSRSTTIPIRWARTSIFSSAAPKRWSTAPGNGRQ